MNKDQVAVEMPRYECHKRVWALKIKAIRQTDGESNFEGGSWLLDVEQPGYAPIEVSHRDYMLKHSPYAGGYYVVYTDGYKSFSPAKAFEDGYTRVDPPVHPAFAPHQQRVIDERAELDERLGKLRSFFNGQVFNDLPAAERHRLGRQAEVMADYSTILADRIAAFKE